MNKKLKLSAKGSEGTMLLLVTKELNTQENLSQSTTCMTL